jgi:hypothetical protein
MSRASSTDQADRLSSLTPLPERRTRKPEPIRLDDRSATVRMDRATQLPVELRVELPVGFVSARRA